jgi:hypothetical protein
VRPPLFLAALAGAALALGGCVPTRYAWGDYEQALYNHQRSPQERQAFVAALQLSVLEAGQGGRLMPPGLFAEYGYALYEAGDLKQAVLYFEKERDLWPESRVLMEKMIRNVSRQGGAP